MTSRSLDMRTVYLTNRTAGLTLTLGRNDFGHYCVDRHYANADHPVRHLFSSDRMGAFNLYCRLRDHAKAVAALKGERAPVANHLREVAYDDAQTAAYLNERAA